MFVSNNSILWNRIEPQERFQNSDIGMSHTRNVFVSQPLPMQENSHRWVAKIMTPDIKQIKAMNYYHAEEVAYKISKLFGWNTIPKTKILHASDINNSKYVKYLPLMQQFFLDIKTDISSTFTFTFQTYITGEILITEGNPAEFVKHDVNLSSYQKAFLLNLILGRGDTRGDNTIYNKETKELFEIDNEYIGGRGDNYPENGSLNNFKELKLEIITKEIIDDLFKVDHSKILDVKNKYTERDFNLSKIIKEKEGHNLLSLNKLINSVYQAFSRNLLDVQAAFRLLEEQQVEVTLDAVENKVKKINADREEENIKASRLAEKQKKEELLRQEEVKRKMNPPVCTGDSISDISTWITDGRCVVLHDDKKNVYIYYQGEETCPSKTNLIFLNINSNLGLLEKDELPSFIELAGIPLANEAFCKKLFELKVYPKDTFLFRYGY